MLGIKDFLQQARGLKDKMEEMQESLAEKTVVGNAGGDMVKAEANGAQEILSIQIERDLLNSDDPELLQDLIVSAVNDALLKSKKLAQEEMSKLTGGFKIPGLDL